jgi:hypothetical protein
MCEPIRRGALPHILWLGGPPDSGKTSIAATLGQRYGVQVYHFDRHEPAHFARADPRQSPALYAAHPDRLGPERRWLGSSPATMARETIASWTERAAMAFDDLRALPASPRIVAEGPGFFPATIAPLVDDPRRALWLLPTEPFKRASVARRQKLAGLPVSDLARARENLIARDLLLGEVIETECRALGLTLLWVDGSRDLAAMVALVEAHFAPFLR